MEQIIRFKVKYLKYANQVDARVQYILDTVVECLKVHIYWTFNPTYLGKSRAKIYLC